MVEYVPDVDVYKRQVVMVRVRLEGLPDEVQRIADAMQAAGCVLERSREYPNLSLIHI